MVRTKLERGGGGGGMGWGWKNFQQCVCLL